MAGEAHALELLLEKLEADVTDGMLAGACLDALLAMLAESPANQRMFLELRGLHKVAKSLPPECVDLLVLCHKSACLHHKGWSAGVCSAFAARQPQLPNPLLQGHQSSLHPCS